MNLSYALALLITSVIATAIVLIAWKRRSAPGASGLILVMLAEIVWAGTYAVRWIVADPAAQLFWLDVTYFGAAPHATLSAIFALQFTNRSHLLTRRNLALLFVVPIVTLVLLWTDKWHNLFFGGHHSTGSILDGGPWFWFFIIYTFIQIIFIISLYVQAFLRPSSLYRRQVGTVLLASLLPVLGVSIGLAGISPFPNLDITPFVFTISGLIYAYALFGFRLLDVVPVARDRLVEEMADGVIVLDVQNRIVDVNPALKRLVGISIDVIGKPAPDILGSLLHLDPSQTSTAVSVSELHLSQNPPRDIELQILPLLDKHQNLSGRLLILHDISERKQAEAELRQAHDRLEQRVLERTAELQEANIQLEKAARLKDEFLSSMSHELRTPLTGILGLSEVLQISGYGPLTEKQSNAISNIHSSGQHLLELINDLLDFSRLSAGKFEMEMAPCPLAKICQSSLDLIAAQAAAKNLHSSFTMTDDSISVNANPRRLKQILANLLGNAIKFTPQGGSFGIEVRGSAQQSETENLAGRQLHITVWDTGIGIQQEDLPRLFKPFIQLDARLAREYAGTGLGLALVHRLTELHGGSVSVQSTPGQGSRFTVTLPC